MSRIEEAIGKALERRGEQNTLRKVSPSVAAPEKEADFSAYDQEGGDVVHVRPDNPYIVTIRDPGSPVSEEYKKLKSMVVKLTRGEHFLNTLMVTSSIGGEGKSVTALNLAISLAQEYDHTVLLVDADLRKPSLHKYMNIDVDRGITECLLGEADLKDVLIKTDIGRLSFLPAGKRVSNPVELLSSHKMQKLVEEMKNRYPERYIIIDTPPILPFAETRALSSFFDGVVFVVKEGKARMQSISEALGLLKGSNVLGMVYNGADSGRPGGYNPYYDY